MEWDEHSIAGAVIGVTVVMSVIAWFVMVFRDRAEGRERQERKANHFRESWEDMAERELDRRMGKPTPPIVPPTNTIYEGEALPRIPRDPINRIPESSGVGWLALLFALTSLVAIACVILEGSK